MAIEAEQRANVVREARRWIATPYHDQADVLGAGVDCGMIKVRVFVDTGLIPAFDPRPYPSDWMLHRDDERFLQLVQRFAAREFDPAETAPGHGDVVVWQHGRTFSHGGIVTGAPGTLSGWPFVVHAYAPAGLVEEVDVTQDAALMRLKTGAPRPMRAFSYWPAAGA
jgi:cell wall-associated NlpC family hydrolase